MNTMKTLSFILLLSACVCVATATTPTVTPVITHLGTLPKVGLNDIRDLNISELNPAVHNVIYTSNENLCIYTSAAAHNYNISIESSNGTHYELSNGTHMMPVELWWNEHADAQNAQQLIPNQALLVQNNSGSADPNCPDGLNANLQLRINSDQLAGLPSGPYSATFEIIVTAAT